jgi:regulator of protease activity HflC (stomatin/prohibitin superfamily)
LFIVLILTLLSLILQQQNQQPYLLKVDAITSQEWSIIKPFVKTGIGVTGCALGVATCAACVRVITTGDECLVERFGKYHRRLDAGWHVLLPLVERVSFHATTREQVLDVPPQQCYTKDNAPIKADAVVYMRIQDVISAKYNVEDVYSAIMNLCLTQLREQVGKLTLDESFSSRDRINYALLKDLNEVCQGWGIQITRVELQNLQPSPTIKEAMELQMAAERKKRSAILKSEGERTTLINEAEGRAQAAICDAEAQSRATILKAEAESNRQRIEAEGLQIAIEAITDAIMKNQNQTPDNTDSKARENAVEGAIQFLSVLRFLETQAKFADSNNSKVIMLPSKDSLPLTYGGLKYLMD